MPRRKINQSVNKIADEYIDEIIGKLANNPAVEQTAVLPFDAASLQREFNAQLEIVLKREFVADELLFWKSLLSLDECKIFADDETALFVKIFGNVVGLFGFGEAGGNFKILSLCFTKPEKRREVQTLNFVFEAFTKVFLPKVDTSEIVAVLKENHFFNASGITFEFVRINELNMMNVFAEFEEVLT